MFIGEAPGRLGADNSGIPFHGDKAGHNFEELLNFANLDRAICFVTNAVLCNPRDEQGNNSTPTKIEIQNCATHLEAQIRIINPKIVVTLGATALESTRYTSPHQLNLRDNVRTANTWNDRILIPLYHPGQRAMMHRSFANQRSDYQFVAEQLRRLSKTRTSSKNVSVNREIIPVVVEILSLLGTVDYFQLHKLFYLTEYSYFKQYGERLTNSYIVRQKDGPYCTDLHLQKLKKSIAGLVVNQRNSNLFLTLSPGLFDGKTTTLSSNASEVISMVTKKYGFLTNEEIKSKVYLTTPMRNMLRLERDNHLNLYNAPIQF